MIKAEFCKSVIRSQASLTYQQASDIIKSKESKENSVLRNSLSGESVKCRSDAASAVTEAEKKRIGRLDPGQHLSEVHFRRRDAQPDRRQFLPVSRHQLTSRRVHAASKRVSLREDIRAFPESVRAQKTHQS